MLLNDPVGRSTRNPTVDVAVWSGAELLLGLSAYLDDRIEPPPVERAAWVDHAASRLTPALRWRLHALRERYRPGLLALAARIPAPHDAEALLAHLARSDPRALAADLLGDLEALGMSREALRAAAGGDAGAREEALRLAALRLEAATDRFVRNVLDSDPGELQRLLSRAVGEWYARVFWPRERDFATTLERDVLRLRSLGRGASARRVVRLAIGGREPARVTGAQHLVLVPQIAYRPWTIVGRLPSARIIFYPVGDASLGRAPADTPPDHLARATRALGDSRRLRALRLLADRPLALPDLASRLGVAKSTAHHHLAALREAGFVTLTPGAEGPVYQLRREPLAEVSALLSAYLQPPPTDRCRAWPRWRGKSLHPAAGESRGRSRITPGHVTNCNPRPPAGAGPG